MTKTWRKKCKEVIREMAAYGERANRGAGRRELAALREKIAEEFQVDLPKEYLALLKRVNGIEYNGFILYGVDEELRKKAPEQSVDGLIGMNQTWRENQWERPWLFLGESGVGWYVYDPAAQRYYELDNPSGTVCEEFSDLGAMLEKLFADALLS